MVNFNNETTVQRPASDVFKILILQRRADLIEQIENYIKLKEQTGSDGTLYLVRARANSLFLEIQPMIERKIAEEEYNILKENLKETDEVTVMEVVEKLISFIDRIGITKIDTKHAIDRTIAENVNKTLQL